jgi:ADP-ribose pyrophosphatase YjhB (NUDIX family)
MSTHSKWHRHLGFYGICIQENKLLVVLKSRGPYINRFDLPGGSMEPDEFISTTLTREFIEESGVEIEIKENIGVKDFLIPWTRPGHTHTHCHHIAVFYKAEIRSGDITKSNTSEDSIRAEWIDLDKLTILNSSPLVIEAINWLTTGEIKPMEKKYNEWIKNE